MIHARPSHSLPLAPSDYAVAALIGLLAAGALFAVSAAVFDWDPLASRRFVVPLVAAGPLVACALTYLSRRLLDVTARLAPTLMNELAGGPVVNLRLKAAVALVAIACITAALLLGLQGLLGGTGAPTDRCILSSTC